MIDDALFNILSDYGARVARIYESDGPLSSVTSVDTNTYGPLIHGSITALDAYIDMKVLQVLTDLMVELDKAVGRRLPNGRQK